MTTTDPRRMDLDQRLALRLPPDHPDYDAFYDATDDELAAMVPPPGTHLVTDSRTEKP